MSWAEGLARLGFDVVFVEQLHDGGDRRRLPPGAVRGLACAERCCGPAADRGDDPRTSCTTARPTPRCWSTSAATCAIQTCSRRCRLRAFVDLDPGYTQIWHAEGHDVGLGGHDLHFTVGANVGTRHSTLPDWRHALASDPPAGRARPLAGLGRRIHALHDRRQLARRVRPGRVGRTHATASRRTSSARFAGVPAACRPAVRDRARHPPGRRRRPPTGWQAPAGAWCRRTRCPRPPGFASYVRGSRRRVLGRAGRLRGDGAAAGSATARVRYLASGRPALVQDTGFSRTLPVGEGLLAFRTPDEAARRPASWSTTTPVTARAARRTGGEGVRARAGAGAAARGQRGGAVRILVAGMVAGVPGQGGATWAVLQYVLGLRRLGHDVRTGGAGRERAACRLPVRGDRAPLSACRGTRDRRPRLALLRGRLLAC